MRQKNFLSTVIGLLLTNFSTIYSVIWAVLFCIYVENYSYPSNCNRLKKWDRFLYIILLMTNVLQVISALFQSLFKYKNKETNIPTIILGCRTCLSCTCSLIFVVGIVIVYFQTKDVKKCGILMKLNLAYIIAEWTILGAFFLCVFLICMVSIRNKIKIRNANEEEEIKEEEIAI